MLTSDQVKPFLSHPDMYVRRAAGAYFCDSWSRDPAILPLILQQFDSQGTYLDQVNLGRADQLAVGHDGLLRTLDLLAGCKGRDDQAALNHILVRTPVELMHVHEAALRKAPNLKSETRKRLERRRECSTWSGERLWQELQDFAQRSRDQRYVGSIDHNYADDLVAVLATSTVPDPETLCQLLAKDEPEDHWLETFVVDLAGERRGRETVPQLVAKYRIDTDYLRERVTEALAKIGDPEAIRLIRATYLQEEWHCRLYASTLLGRIKHEESEAACLALLELEEDVGLQTKLCANLCELISERGVEVILREIQAGYDAFGTNLEDRLLNVADMLGIALPNGEAWRADRDIRTQRVAANVTAMARGEFPPFPFGKDPGANFPAPSGAPRSALPPPSDRKADTVAAKPTGIRKESKRVGRNEPCPCGSGKKFKKCCGGR